MSTPEDSGGDGDLLAIVVEALEPYDIPAGGLWTEAERAEPARKVLAALGLERVGQVNGVGTGPMLAMAHHTARVGDVLYRVTAIGGDVQ